MASKVVLLDNVLARYGPEAREAREMLQHKVADLLTRVWPNEPSATSTWTPTDGITVFDKIEQLSPKDEDQRSKRTLALGMEIELRHHQNRLIQALWDRLATFSIVLDRRSRKSSILWQAAASHPHQRRTKGEIRRDTDEEHGGNENCSNVTKVSQTFSIMKHSIRYRAS